MGKKDDLDKMRRELEAIVAKNRKAFEGTYADDLEKLQGLSQGDLDEITPNVTDHAGVWPSFHTWVVVPSCVFHSLISPSQFPVARLSLISYLTAALASVRPRGPRHRDIRAPSRSKANGANRGD